MSEENVEVVRARYEAWNRGDMDALRELFDPDVIMRSLEGWPEPGPFVGRDAVMREFEYLRETWDADAMEPISGLRDANDRVLVRQVWHGAGYGPESNMEFTVALTVRKGRVYFVEHFWDDDRVSPVRGFESLPLRRVVGISRGRIGRGSSP